MKLQPDSMLGVNAIQAQRDGLVVVNGVEWRTSLLLPWQGEVRPWGLPEWPARFDDGQRPDLSREHFALLTACGPELVIFGSGPRLRFVSPGLLAPLLGQHIGVETMDTAAACRTYNILAGEGRKVVAALLL